MSERDGDIPMVLKGWRLHSALEREYYDGLREGLIWGAAYGTVFWLLAGGVMYLLMRWQ